MQSSETARNAANRLAAAFAVLVLALPAAAGPAPSPATLFSHPEVVTLPDGTKLELTAGQLFVPESREQDTGRVLSIPFYRVPSRAAEPAPAIFLLAGGPGSSWLERFATQIGSREVLFYRELADVVLLDQRGAGRSRPRMDCPESVDLPADAPMSEAAQAAALRRLALACRAKWQEAGVMLEAYHTKENAADVDALRAALGYEHITLIAGSYGSHLALSMIRQYPETIARAMLRGLEGPDHTYDMPSGVLAALSRLAAAAEADPALAPHLPEGGLIAALKAVQARLERSPESVQLTVDGEERRVRLDKTDVQRHARHGANRSGEWPAFVIRMARGDFAPLARLALEARSVRLLEAGPMFYMMDCASGISPAREAQILGDPARAVLGNLNLHYFATCEAWQAPDLGDEFRADLVSALPVLLFQGTWDLSTPLENGREVARGFSNGHYVEVEGGSHATFDDLYEHWPPMQNAVRRFVRGEDPELPERIVLPPVKFVVPEPRLQAPHGSGN